MNDKLSQISVIVPTYNGAERISRVLDALIKQHIKDFELIIVIDGSRDNTEEILNSYSSKFKKINIISQSNKGRAGARNRGAIEASGDLFVFYDDDMVPDKFSVQRHKEKHETFGNNVIIGGNQVEDIRNAKSEFERYRCFLRNRWLQSYTEAGTFLGKNDLYLTAANFSISKKLFQELEGFNESFFDAEDFELAIRAYEKGIKIFFDKKNIALHEDHATVRSYIQRRKQYEKARKQLSEKHPEFLTTYERSFSKIFIYWLFSFNFWVKAIETGYLSFLPKFIRYKIFTLTIWGLSQYFPEKEI